MFPFDDVIMQTAQDKHLFWVQLSIVSFMFSFIEIFGMDDVAGKL